MKRILVTLCTFTFLITTLITTAHSSVGDKNSPDPLSKKEISSLVKPIALYPDILIKNILPASTYPDQIVDAALLIKDKSDASKIKDQSWAQSVKIISTYPGILKMLYKDLDWTTKLGEAFMFQSKDVLDAIQDIRRDQHDDGKLESDSRQKVTVDDKGGTSIVQIEPANPQVVYVPQETTVVTGGTYTNSYDLAPIVTFGLGMAVGSALADDDEDHYYYSGWGGPSFWYSQSPANQWLDNRREAWEDYNDRAWDKQEFRQGQRDDRQDFRQDMYEQGKVPTLNRNLSARGYSSSDIANARSAARNSTAFQNFGSRAQTATMSSRGYSSRVAGGGFSGGGFRGRGRR